jgi:hypothetical protein
LHPPRLWFGRALLSAQRTLGQITTAMPLGLTIQSSRSLLCWNYYALSLKQPNSGAENGEGQVLIPFKVEGIQQIFHIDPQVVTAPAATSGPRTGLRDAQFYNLTLITQDVGLQEKVTFGIRPLIAAPTNTGTNFGPNSLQGGVAGGIIGPVGLLLFRPH